MRDTEERNRTEEKDGERTKQKFKNKVYKYGGRRCTRDGRGKPEKIIMGGKK